MIPSIHSLLALSLGLLTLVDADFDTKLVGTWTSKSKAVLTGPGFYDPVKDRLIEPALTGISYSFTGDGYYEEAYYRAIPNRTPDFQPGLPLATTPSCPSSIMQWQHGTYSLPGNGSIILQPFSVDGRQVMSSPCSYSNAVYTRYDQPELIKTYAVGNDAFHNIQKLNLFKFDGSPIMPLYLAMTPPQMLPTSTLNPLTTATATPTHKSRVKRGLDEDDDLAQRTLKDTFSKPGLLPIKADLANPDKWWWAGVGFIAVGTVLYMWPTSVL